MDAAGVAAVLRQRIHVIRECYEAALLVDRRLHGRLDVQFTIDASGRISRISTRGFAETPAFTECVVRVLVPLQFPQPEGGSVEFSFPFNFHPER